MHTGKCPFLSCPSALGQRPQVSLEHCPGSENSERSGRYRGLPSPPGFRTLPSPVRSARGRCNPRGAALFFQERTLRLREAQSGDRTSPVWPQSPGHFPHTFPLPFCSKISTSSKNQLSKCVLTRASIVTRGPCKEPGPACLLRPVYGRWT